jgi:hypothetical protein
MSTRVPGPVPGTGSSPRKPSLSGGRAGQERNLAYARRCRSVGINGGHSGAAQRRERARRDPPAFNPPFRDQFPNRRHEIVRNAHDGFRGPHRVLIFGRRLFPGLPFVMR